MFSDGYWGISGPCDGTMNTSLAEPSPQPRDIHSVKQINFNLDIASSIETMVAGIVDKHLKVILFGNKPWYLNLIFKYMLEPPEPHCSMAENVTYLFS